MTCRCGRDLFRMFDLRNGTLYATSSTITAEALRDALTQFSWSLSFVCCILASLDSLSVGTAAFRAPKFCTNLVHSRYNDLWR